MKKIILIIITLFFNVTFVAAYEWDFYQNGIYYEIISYYPSQVKVVSYNGYPSYSGSVVIPSIVYNAGIHYDVKSIDRYAFKDCSGLTSITIPSSVTTIESHSFMNCTSLTSVTIPNSVTSIGGGAFSGCIGLTSVTIPNSVTRIESGAFSGCSGLTSVTIPNSVTRIESGAFSGCSGLTSVTIPNSVTIESYAFSGCSGLTSITIPNSVTSISGSAFSRCSNLISIIVDSDNIKYDSRNNCNAIIETQTNKLVVGCKNSIIPNDVISIGDYAFSDCIGLTNITIPNSVTSIESSAFSGCSGLTSVTIGNSVTSIESYAFASCSGLTSVTIPNSVTSIENAAFSGCIGLTSVTIPNGNIKDNAFLNCTGLTNVTIGVNVSNISTDAFKGCINLSTLNFNAKNCSVGTYGEHWYNGHRYDDYPAFYNYTSLTNVNIGDSVEGIPHHFLYGCTGITSITIPKNVTGIGDDAFKNCNIQTLNWNAKNCYTSVFKNKTSISSITIGDSVQVIPSSVFSGCSGLTSITIPNSVTSIGSYAFQDCSGLTSVTIGNSVTSIGNKAFYNCTGLTSINFNAKACRYAGARPQYEQSFYNLPNLTYVNFGDSVRIIPKYLFYGCTGITNILLPNTIDSVENQAFSGCNNARFNTLNLSNASYIGDSAFYNCEWLLGVNTKAKTIRNRAFASCDRLVSVNLTDSTKYIGDSAFYDCYRLTDVTFANTVDTIRNSAFRACVRLNRPTLPDFLRYIGEYAFGSCKLFNGKLTIPSLVTYIGNYAFDSCSSITSLDMKCSQPPTIFSNTFRRLSTYIPVYVPCGSYTNYYITNYWENFYNLTEATPYLITVLSDDTYKGSVSVVQQPTCSNGQTKIKATATSQYHFVRWNDGNTQNPRTFIATRDTTFTAYFANNSASISVVSDDNQKGITSGTGTYGYMQDVTISATGKPGYHFICWTDGVSDNPRTIVASQDSVFTAHFVSNNSNIIVENANPEMGNVEGNGVYYYNNQVTISATPNYGYHFVQWSDGNTANPRTIMVDRDSIFTAQFDVNTYVVSVSSNNTTMGTATGGGSFNYNTQIGLTATPNYGYHFAQWNDGSIDNPRTVRVERDSSFTAQFVANTYIVYVEPNDPTMGSTYGGGIYNYNSQTTIAAMSTYGYHFTQWSDGSTENPRIVTITSGANYTAIFEINTYDITVNSANPAIGSTSGGGTYSYNMPVNITALPNYGYHFVQWSDGNTDNPRLINVVQNATYTAQFAVNSYAVSVASNNDMKGSVSGSNSYIYNTPATITATPNYGYHFTQWNDGNTQNPRTFVVTQDVSYTAQFDNNNYTITTNTNNNAIGSVSGAGVYPYNDIIALTANANAHYHFTHWGDGVEDNPRTITILQDSVFTAYFEIDTHSVVLNTNDIVKGSVSGAGVYNYGSVINISAMSNYGYHFVSWSDGNTNSSRNIQVTSDTTITANFIENDYNIILYANDTNRGNVYGQGSYSYTSQVILTATAKYGYHFTQWSDGNTDNPRNLQITSDSTLTAIFDKNTYTLTLNTNNNFGTVDGSGTYEYLYEVSISATAVEHYHFLSWNDGNTQNPRTLSIESDTILTAAFVIDTHSVVLNTTDENILTVTGGGEYAYGETITIEAIPIIGYHFTQWSDGDTNNPRQILLTHDTILTASFAINIYHIDVQANIEEGGEVSGEGDYEYNTLQTISATANAHFHFIQWNDGNTSNPRQILISADSTFTAQFEEDEKYDIIVVSANNAMGTVEGSGTYYLGEQVSITAIPNDGYRFEQWSDGNTENPRQITILQNATYVANFAQGVGLDEVKEDIVVRLYPNPTQDNTTLYLENINEDVKVILTDIQGRTLQTYTVKSGENSLSLNTSSLASGTYYVRIIGNTIQRTEKIIKK